MEQDTFQEISRHKINLNKNEGTILSWHNDVLAVCTDKGFSFFELSLDLQCYDKTLNCLESVLPTPISSPASDLFTSNFFKSGIKNVELIEMILDRSMWPHNKQLTEEMATVIMCAWAPQRFLPSYKYTIAVLNNVGGVDIFVQEHSKWFSIFNMSSHINNHFKRTINSPHNFEEMRSAIQILETTAITWFPKLNEDDFYYFVTAQKSGDILIWKFDTKKSLECSLEGCVQTTICDIMTVVVVPNSKSNGDFYIICSDILGRVTAFHCQIQNHSCNILSSHKLWAYEDRMIVKYLICDLSGEKITLLFNKHRHLVAELYDMNFNLISSKVINVNDFTITSVTQTPCGTFLTTVNCKMYKVDLTINNMNLDITLIPMKINDIHSTYELYSAAFSKNGIICALGVIDNKLFYRKESLKIDIIFTCNYANLESIVSLLINNPSKMLTDYSDCIEMLRYRTIKLGVMPTLDYDQFYKSGMADQYSLKLYLILLILYNNLKTLTKLPIQHGFPETSITKVREQILAHHATSFIKKLCTTYQISGKLTDFEYECYVGTKKYLEYCMKKHNFPIKIESNDLHLPNTYHPYICQCCDETIEGFTCKNGHLNRFCSLTFTLIDDIDCLVCRSCGFIARIELQESNPTCPFCDLFFVK